MQLICNNFMLLALEQAERALLHNEVPVGAVIVHNQQVVAAEHNLCVSLKDPTAHAEMLAIRKAASHLGQERLFGCELYVTLEPCPMCAHAISLARISTVFWGCDDLKGGGILNGPRLYNQHTCTHKPEIMPGIMAPECGAILQKFFKSLRYS